LKKDLDERHVTKGGGTIRVQTWVDDTGAVIRYTLAYVNRRLFDEDNGRLVGYDNSHTYEGFTSKHHRHWMGSVEEVASFSSFDDTLDRFMSDLAALRQRYGKDY
jgi:hypothetical protein